MSMPTCRQKDDVYEAFTRLSTSCDNLDKEAAISACEDLIRASQVILAGLGGLDSDASYYSSSEESSNGLGTAVAPFDSEYGGGELHDHGYGDGAGDSVDNEDGDDYDDDEEESSSASDADSSGSNDGLDDPTSEADSSDDENLSYDDLVADYSGSCDPARRCDRCERWGHTNQYCPTLPLPKLKRRRV